MVDGYVTIQTKMDTSNIDKQISLLENKLETLEEEYRALEKAKPFEDQDEQLIKLGNEIGRTRRKIAQLREEKEKMNKVDFSGLKGSIENVGNGVEKVIKKITRWRLAIFGIRSAYMAVRQAMSTNSQYDNQMKANIDYIRFALANILKPVIEWIINGVYKLLYYVNYIAQAWFGVNLFANSSAKAFASANNNAQKLKNTLTSFDEVNVLQDNESGTEGISMPSFDLSKNQNIEIPWWVDWIAKNKDTLLKIGEVFAGLFVASKVADWLGLIDKLIGGKTSGLNGILTALMAIAAYELIKVDIQLVKDAIKQYNDLAYTVDNAAEKGKKSIQLEEEWSEKIEKRIDDLDESTRLYEYYTRAIGLNNNTIKTNVETLKNQSFWEGIVDTTLNGEYSVYSQNTKAIAENSKELKNNIEKLSNMASSGSLTKKQIDNTKISLENMIPELEKQRDGLVKGTDQYKNMEDAIKIAKDTLSKFKDGSIKARDGVDELTDSVKDYNQTGISDKTTNIRVDANTTSFKQAIDRAVEYAKKQIGGLGFSVGGGGNIGGSGGGFRAKGGIYYPSKLPKLAVGGIINNPGMGVPYNGAIIGERGAEAVVPLTDSQQMALLGETIGKYITVELTNITELDGRQIARKVEQIQQNDNFVLNR